MRVDWEILIHEGRTVECQMWRPMASSRKLVLFCPGFPGVGAALFEQRHAAALAEAGFDLAVLRHAGTRFDAPSAPLMINNAARLNRARRNQEKLMGGVPAKIADWLDEPLTALHALESGYDEIIVIGNSFGALSALWSLSSAGAPLSRVKSLLLLAGAQGVPFDGGVTDIMRIWKPEFIAHPRITERVALEDARNVAATIQDVYTHLVARTIALPPHIDLTAIVVARDEILRPSDAEKFHAATGGRGRIVVDEQSRAYPDHLLIAHDMPDYLTDSLLQLF